MSCEHTSRCSGHCCKRFFLPVTPEELKLEAEKERTTGSCRFGSHQEIQKVEAMVVFIETEGSGNSYYTCRHHDTVTGNCMNYEQRPLVCKDYPFYGDPMRQCNYAGCTWEAATNPVVPETGLTKMMPIKRAVLASEVTKEVEPRT